jgi:protocatechuate 3,4-dioxygenase beta subunit
VIYGQVTDENGIPIENALADVWQSNDTGFYDVQDEHQPEMNLRGIFMTDVKGKFGSKQLNPLLIRFQLTDLLEKFYGNGSSSHAACTHPFYDNSKRI